MSSSSSGADQPVAGPSDGAPPVTVHRVWPGEPPAWNAPVEEEKDTSGPDGRMVADRPVIRLGNVAEPQLHLYRPRTSASDTLVVICPGGGYSILAWDLEGTEIAEWLRGIGVTAAVLKYRVPTRGEPANWLAPVQDIQRSVAMIRSGAIDGIKAERVGVLGFSAGGNAATRAATASRRHYEAIDEIDSADWKPDFGILVYPAWLVEQEDPKRLIEDLEVTESTPPMFFAHARDDRVTCMSSVTMFAELQRLGIPAALHVFSGGGHGFGARPTGAEPDAWPSLCEAWMRDRGWLSVE